MEIYQAEINDGLADKVANSKISIACELFTKNDAPVSQSRELLARTIATANPNQKDLFYKHSILASVGWNANDDVFDAVETWNARSTPSDKQINFMHNELEIIGHSTSSFVYDRDGKLVPNDTAVANLPKEFDVVTEFVLYTMWDNEERQEMMQKLISEINEGKWYVSMECRFPAFDYAVIDTDKTHRTIARNQNTAFLTKHLRAFGGSGEYEGRRIGRLIRNLFFSGQGIVDKPANQRSVIFDKALTFNSKGSLIIKGQKQMEEELKKQIAELKTQLEAANKQKFEETIAELKTQLKDATDALAKAEKAAKDKEEEDKEKDDKAMCALKEKDKALAELTTELKTANDKLVVANAELNSIKKESALTARVSKLVAVGLSDEDAKATAAKWSALEDAQFDDIIAMQKDKIEASKKTVETKEEKTEAAFDDAKKEANANLNTNTEKKAEDEFKAISAFLGGAMPYARSIQDKKKN